MRARALLVSLLSLSSLVSAQQIAESADKRQWTLTAGEMSYVVGVNEQQMVETLYWGPRLAAGATLPPAHSQQERASFDPAIALTPLEYPAWGAGLFTEPALKLTSANGDRTLVFEFKSATHTADTLEITLADTVQPIAVHLRYKLYSQGILERSSRIENTGKAAALVEQAASATWNLPPGSHYALSTLTGQWAGEWQLHTAPVHPGAEVIESRRGSTSHQANPWFAVSHTPAATDATTELAGPVWFGELGWSGSWRIAVEQTALSAVRITGGFHPYDFSYTLKPHESLETPPFYAGYTAAGQGEASRILHRFQREAILPHVAGDTSRPDPKPRPIIFNSWEATEFNVGEPGQIALAEKAASIGVERFVIDDGWFGARKNDHAGLGDWTVNKTKFPNGLKPVIDRVHALGMDFGLWVEPEMVNPDSDLYRTHPDWAMSFPGRQRTEQRNQLVLNLARPEVKEYVFGFLDRLVSENDIAFLKWDYNRNWSEPGWDSAPGSTPAHPDAAAQKEIYVRYVQNLYEVLARLRAKHPKLEIESCSGGGGRVDLGILRLTDEVWPSDNTDALDRLLLQNGFSHAYAPQMMVAWVTDVPNYNGRSTPLEFRFLVAMQGALGIGNNLNKLTPAELAQEKELIAFYKTVRTTVQHGRLYRLLSPLTGDAANPTPSESSAVQYTASAADRAGAQTVVLAYLRSQQLGMAFPILHLQGLDANATYRIRPLRAGFYSGPETASGSVLMGQGIRLDLHGDYDAAALVIEATGPGQ